MHPIILEVLFLFSIIPSLSLHKTLVIFSSKGTSKKKSVSCGKKQPNLLKQRSYIGQFNKKNNKRPTPNAPSAPLMASNFSTAGVTSSNWGVWQQQQRYQPPHQ